MKPRMLVVVLVIGVVGLTAMGFLTKVVFESNKGLQAVSRFKVEFLDRFGERGVEEISYRRQREPRGTLLVVTAPVDRIRTDDSIHEDIACFYAEAFPREHGALSIEYRPRPSFGCSPSDPYLEREVSLRDVRRQLTLREYEEKLREKLAESRGLDLARLAEVDEGWVVEVTGASRDVLTDERVAKETLASVAADVATIIRPRRGAKLDVSLGPPPPRRPVADPPVASSPAAMGAEGSTDDALQAPALRAEFDYRGRPIRS